MGVRFDKLTPASQPTLEKILAEKGKREPSGPNANTVSGKSGVSALPVRRPSSTFSAVEPLLGAAPAAPGASSAGPIGGALPGPAGNPFAASSPSGIGSSPLARATQPLSSLSSASPGRRVRRRPVRRSRRPARPVRALCPRWRARARSTASRPGPTSAPSDRPVRLAQVAGAAAQDRRRLGTGHRHVGHARGSHAARGQRSDPDRRRPARVRQRAADARGQSGAQRPGGQPGREHHRDLEAGSHADRLSRSYRWTTWRHRRPARPRRRRRPPRARLRPTVGWRSGAAMRTTSPDGTAGADAAAISPGRLSSSQPVVGRRPDPGSLATDLAQTVPASARISAVTRRCEPIPRTPRRGSSHRRRSEPAWSSSWAASPARCWRSAHGSRSSRRATSRRNPPRRRSTNAAAPAPAPAAPAIAAPEGAKTEPAAANPAGEAKVGEAKAGEPRPGEPAAAEPKAGEPKAAEAKPAEPAAAEAKPAEAKPEAKPADTKIAVAESAAARRASGPARSFTRRCARRQG